MCLYESGMKTNPQGDGDKQTGRINWTLVTTRQRMHKERTQNLNNYSSEMSENP